jgi:aminopeptidase YwaD
MISFDELAIERPVGSENNRIILNKLKNEAEKLGYHTISLPMKTQLWDGKDSFLEQNGIKVKIHPSPFSPSFKGRGKLVSCQGWQDVEDHPNSFLVFQESITKEGLMPLNFPVYFPPEHKEIYGKIIRSDPKCIITETGKQQMSGLDPHPYFEDGNFQYPTAYKGLDKSFNYEGEAYVEINSQTRPVMAEQLLIEKKGQSAPVILICAHMDSKYNTPGALDNAAGVYTLVKLLDRLEGDPFNSTIHIMPFNGEENYGLPGQVRYLDYIKENKRIIKAVINIDSPGCRDSQNAVSFYNIDEKRQEELLGKTQNLIKGVDWFAGDHAMFAFQGIPCIAATSGNLFEIAIRYTHTERDTKEIVDLQLIEKLAVDLHLLLMEIDK